MQANENYWTRIKLLLQLDLIASGNGEREHFHEQNEYFELDPDTHIISPFAISKI